MPDQLANLFETAVTAMAVAGLAGHFRRVNAACCELLGRSEEELLATSFTAISHPDEIGKEPPMAARLITGDVGSHRTTRRLRRGDGSVVDVEITASLLRDDEG